MLEEEDEEGDGDDDDDETAATTPTPPSLLIAAAASAIMLRLLFWLPPGTSDMVRHCSLSIAKGLVVVYQRRPSIVSFSTDKIALIVSLWWAHPL